MRAGAVQIGALDGGAGTDSLLFDILSGEASVTGAITGWETVRKTGAGTLTLRDTGTISPGLSFLAGTLLAEGTLGATAISAPTGATLGGSGSLGAVTIADGATLSPGGAGAGVGTLTMSSLILSSTSRLLFNLGAPGQVGGADNDLINVTGNLTLDGLLDINPRAAFGVGVYRLINYGGALTDGGLTMGTAPSARYDVQTSVAGQVNLVVGLIDDLSIQFWDDGDTSPDGVVDGGAGTWSTGRTNWTNLGGTANNAWAGNFAVFQNVGGAVTVEGQQGVTGMQFMANGYRLSAGANGALSLNAPQTTIRIDPGITAELALPLIGTGTLVKRDLGTLFLSGTNSYSGGTVIREGVLRVASDGALGAAAGGVTLDGGVLRYEAAASSARAFTIGAGGGTLDAANALTLSGAIGGGGALTKTGAGTLTLSGNSSAYTGSTTISGGVLNITGSLGGLLTIGSGARLGGTGTVGSVTIASGGILAPGNSPGTLNATGNVIFRAGSFYDLEISAAGARDLLAATGTATIEGGTVRVTALDPETQYTDNTRYTFLTAAGGRTGTFTGLTENSAFLDFILGYDGTSAFVTVDVIRTFPDVAQTFNQDQASTALMAFNGGGADALAVYNQLLLLDEGPARAAFDRASGEIYATMLASALRRADGEARRLLGVAQAGSGEGWSLWGTVSGDSGEVEGDGNGAAFEHDAIRGTIGADYRGADNAWALGLGGGYWKGDTTLSARASRAETEGWHLGGYARYGTGGAGVTATLSGAYAQGKAEVARIVSAGSITRAASADLDVDSWAVAGELRYGFELGRSLAVGPFARASMAEGDLGSFSEAGAQSLNLSGSGSNHDGRTRYGGGLFGRWTGASGAIDATVAYVTGGDDPTEVGLVMTGAAGAPYRVRSARGDGEGVELGLGGRFDLGGGWSIGADVAAFSGGN
ncbi:MAG TPA: autotransporter domain-containing protein, partial [Brevundimonas sp.]|uniref:autotransporter outer membrane beta-barrel domain-containing protein n=1 Tax=Brevundimonas sp. TaxID=1871086 RepID=UPI002ED8F685